MGLSGDHPVGVGVAQTHGSVSCNQGEWKLTGQGSGAEWLPVETTFTRDRSSLMKAEYECVMQCPRFL